MGIKDTLFNTSDEDEERVEQWFEDHSEAYPNGIEDIGPRDKGMTVQLSDPLEIEKLSEAIEEHGYEIEGQETPKGYETEWLDTPDGEAVSILVVEELGTVLQRQKVGTTYYDGADEVPLGGVSAPVRANGEPTSNGVEHTLNQLSVYLDSRY